MDTYLRPLSPSSISTEQMTQRRQPLMPRVLVIASTAVLAVAFFALQAIAQELPPGQTVLTIAPTFCGPTRDIRCVFVPIVGGGSLWIQWIPRQAAYHGFIQFSGDGWDEMAGSTSAMSASYSLGQYQALTPSKTNPMVSIEYVLTIHNFSGMDVYGRPFYGSGRLNFHYVFTRGSGRGGGGAGWHMVEDGGTIHISQWSLPY